MREKRVRPTNELRFKVALEAIRGAKQLAQIAEEYHAHPRQVTQWKKELLEKGPELFATRIEQDGRCLKAEREELCKTIGQRQVVISWSKKNLGVSDLPNEGQRSWPMESFQLLSSVSSRA